METTTPSQDSGKTNGKTAATPDVSKISDIEYVKIAALKAVTDMAETYRPVAVAHAASLAKRIETDASIDAAIAAVKIKMASTIGELPLPKNTDEMEERIALLGKISATARLHRVITVHRTSETEDKLR